MAVVSVSGWGGTSLFTSVASKPTASTVSTRTCPYQNIGIGTENFAVQSRQQMEEAEWDLPAHFRVHEDHGFPC